MDGNQVGIKAIDGFPVGFFASGKASEKEAEQPKFESEQYSQLVVGEQGKTSKQHSFIPGEREEAVLCSGVHFETNLSAATKTLATNAAYSGCEFPFGPTTVNMNSCRYDVRILNAGPPYTGEMDIACSKEGDAIETKVAGPFGTCKIVTPAQTGLKNLSFTNYGTGSNRGAEIGFDVGGIKSTFYGGMFLCGYKEGTTYTKRYL